MPWKVVQGIHTDGEWYPERMWEFAFYTRSDAWTWVLEHTEALVNHANQPVRRKIAIQALKRDGWRVLRVKDCLHHQPNHRRRTCRTTGRRNTRRT